MMMWWRLLSVSFLQVQRGFRSVLVYLTALDSSSDFLAVGSSIGMLYLYCRRLAHMNKYSLEVRALLLLVLLLLWWSVFTVFQLGSANQWWSGVQPGLTVDSHHTPPQEREDVNRPSEIREQIYLKEMKLIVFASGLFQDETQYALHREIQRLTSWVCVCVCFCICV